MPAELGTEVTETETSTGIEEVTGGGPGTETTGSETDTELSVGTEGTDDQSIELNLEDTDAEPFASTMPAELRNLISANPAAAPHIQRMFDRLNSYSSIFQTPREAREFRDMFPGGLEDAKGIAAKASELDRSNELLYSGDSAAQAEVLQPMFDDNPDAFMGIMRTSLDVVNQRNPQLASQFTGEVVGKYFQGEKFGEHLEGMYDALQKLSSADEKVKQEGLNSLARMTSTLVKWGASKGFVGKERDLGREAATRPDPKMSKLERENQALREQQWKSFATTVNSGARPQLEKSIKTLIDPAMKAVPEKQRTATTNMLVEQIRTQLEARLKQDTFYQNQYKQWLDAKTIPNADQAIKFLVGRASAHMKAVVKQVMTPWSSGFVNDKNAVNNKIRETGTRVDVTGGNNTGGRSTKSKLTQDEANAMDPKDILGWARSQYDRKNASR